MIIVILLLLLVTTMILMHIAGTDSIFDDACELCSVFTGIGTLISFVAFIVLCILVSKGKTIEQRIEMYQEQNQKIEKSISDLVEKYMDYESTTFSELSPDSTITLVSLYPELKSDTLVAQQCNLYMENNRKITELREGQINLSVYKWWLYFGK